MESEYEVADYIDVLRSQMTETSYRKLLRNVYLNRTDWNSSDN